MIRHIFPEQPVKGVAAFLKSQSFGLKRFDPASKVPYGHAAFIGPVTHQGYRIKVYPSGM
jgi:hypothetical protein